MGGKDNRFLRPRPAIYLWLTNTTSLEYDRLLSSTRITSANRFVGWETILAPREFEKSVFTRVKIAEP